MGRGSTRPAGRNLCAMSRGDGSGAVSTATAAERQAGAGALGHTRGVPATRPSPYSQSSGLAAERQAGVPRQLFPRRCRQCCECGHGSTKGNRITDREWTRMHANSFYSRLLALIRGLPRCCLGVTLSAEHVNQAQIDPFHAPGSCSRCRNPAAFGPRNSQTDLAQVPQLWGFEKDFAVKLLYCGLLVVIMRRSIRAVAGIVISFCFSTSLHFRCEFAQPEMGSVHRGIRMPE